MHASPYLTGTLCLLPVIVKMDYANPRLRELANRIVRGE